LKFEALAFQSRSLWKEMMDNSLQPAGEARNRIARITATPVFVRGALEVGPVTKPAPLSAVVVEIETQDGLVGHGFTAITEEEIISAAIRDVVTPNLIGQDALNREAISEFLYLLLTPRGQTGYASHVISAIDIALWDIAGQAASMPIWKLLGGRFRDSVTAYATGCYYPEPFDKMPDMLRALEEEASSYREAGFGFLKVKVGLLDLKSDAERLRVIRNAVGPDIGIMVDANHAYTASTAIRMGRLMHPFDISFFEEPVVPEDRDGYRRVRRENPIPVAGGECEFTRYGFRDLIAGGCVDIAQPDLAVCGGFSAFIQILALANAYGVTVIPHVWGSGIAVAAALQAIATIPPIPHTANPIPLLNEPVVEFDRKHNPLRDDLLHQRFGLVNGMLHVPEGPGLGVTLNEKALARFCGTKSERAGTGS
jgi:D-galactarolactone cycloisomerase